jgi:hypothetical protein
LQSDDPDYEPGLFVSWGMTPNLNLAGTLNPDFSQVEADVAQLDINNQFSLFFPERRPFFLEGANFFDSRIRATYTRTIADPDWGIKLTGQEGKNGIGVLAAQDAQTNVLLPGPQGSDVTEIDEKSIDGIVRYRRNIGEASTIGALVTGRDGGDYSNLVAGIDTKLRLSNSDTVQAQYLQSDTEYPAELAEENEQPSGAFNDYAFDLSFNHNARNWDARATYRDFGEDFRADLGFVPRVDYRLLVIGSSYEWFADDESWWNRIEVGGDWDRSETQAGELLEEEWEAFAGFSGTMQSAVFVGGYQRKQTFEQIVFDQTGYWFFGEVQPTAAFRFAIEGRRGDAIDFTEARAGIETLWSPIVGFNLGRHLQGRLIYTLTEFDLPEGRLFEAAITELRTVYQINSRAFIRVIAQYTDIYQNQDLYEEEVVPESKELFGQLLFSYRLDARTALYVGYSPGYLEEFDSGLVKTNETFFLKLSYAWTP